MSRNGRTINFWPSLYEGRRQVAGRIIYVHPKGRFVRVAFTGTDFFGREVEHTECLKIVGGKIDTGRGRKPNERKS